jgi:DNA-binding NarL/FixJ family response regulator
MARKIRVLLADDHTVLREATAELLENQPDMEVVGQAGTGEAVVTLAQALRPDGVVMDIAIPHGSGLGATRRLRERWPQVRVIILTTFDDDEYVFEGLRAGAQGYLLKDVSGEELAQAIRTVAAGGALIEPSVARKVVAEFARLAPSPRSPQGGLAEPLSERELEILRLLAQGLSNPEIAARLHLAHGTVKNYVTAILGKLGVRDRTQAALRARELGLT